MKRVGILFFSMALVLAGCSSDDGGAGTEGVEGSRTTSSNDASRVVSFSDTATSTEADTVESAEEDSVDTATEDDAGPSVQEDAGTSGDEDAGTSGDEDAGTSEQQDAGTSGQEDAGTVEEQDTDENVDICADDANDCGALVPPAGGCVAAFTCDSDYTDEAGSHCMPAFKANGSPCVGSLDGQQMQVVPASESATDTEDSVCDRFVCHAEVDATPECVLASTLPTAIQLAMEIEGFFVKNECALAEMPSDVSTACNDWVCGCAAEDCMEAQCKALADAALLGEVCGDADMCTTATCTAVSDGFAECVEHPIECPSVPDAWCVEMPACDAQTGGCPDVKDETKSNQKCAAVGSCLLSATCDPGNTEAEPSTGCVLGYDDPMNCSDNGIVGISAGGSHTLALQADGTLHGWGSSNYGEPPLGVLFRQVSAGKAHSCGLDMEGNVHCWGINDGGTWDFGQVTLTPTQGKFLYVAAGYNHSCAIMEDGTARCWGVGSEDNLTESQEAYGKGQVTLTPSEPDFQQIGAGHGHTCALKKDGSLQCWGSGSGSNDVPEGSHFVSLATGFHHNCALDSTGALTCWGWTKFGLVEDVPEGTFQSVACGYGHTCAVRTTGEVVCWGVPDKGEGAPQVTDSGQSTDAPVVPIFKHVGVDSSHSCAVTEGNKLTCWGSNGANKATPPAAFQL